MAISLLGAQILPIVRFATKKDSTKAYHGVEHMVINAYENDKPITLENVRISSRVSTECGSQVYIYFVFVAFCVFLIVGLIFPIITIANFLTLAFIPCLQERKKPLKLFARLAHFVQFNYITEDPTNDQIEVGIACMSKLLEIEKDP